MKFKTRGIVSGTAVIDENNNIIWVREDYYSTRHPWAYEVRRELDKHPLSVEAIYLTEGLDGIRRYAKQLAEEIREDERNNG